MSDAVLTALIMAAASVVCQVLINRSNREKRKTDEAVKDANLENRMKNIEAKLNVHNSYADKLAEIQRDVAVIKNDIKTLYKQT